MNNWRLLLLALVAVVQPIASFTERNLVDGRQQCCDRRTDSLLRDSRTSLYGTQRKATTLLRNSNDRDETREDRRWELRQRDTVSTRRSTERPLEDIRERDTRRNVVRSTRIVSRPERVSIDENRDRQLDFQRRERHARNIQEVNSEEQTRKDLNRITRDSLMRQNDRINKKSSRNTLSRDEIRINHFTDERQVRDLHYDRERMSARSGDIRQLTRDLRDELRRTREALVRVDISDDNRRDVARERVNLVRRDMPSRVDFRRSLDNNDERRNQERHAEQRRSISENSRLVERVRDVRLRENSVDNRRESRNRIHANRRLTTEGTEERRLQTDENERVRDMRLGENTWDDRRESRDRITTNRRVTTERSEERRLQTDELVERVHEMRPRENSRDDRRESRDHIIANRRVTTERSEERRLQSDKIIRRIRDMRTREKSRHDTRDNRDRISANRLTTEKSEERRLQTDDLVKRVRDMRLRENSRDERRHNRDRIISNQRPTTERSEELRIQTDRVAERVHDLRLRENNHNEKRDNRDRRLTTERPEERRLQADRVVERVRDMRLRGSSSDERRENRDRINISRRLTTERSEERRLQKDNIVERARDRRLRENSRNENSTNRDLVGANQRMTTERSEERNLQSRNVGKRNRDTLPRENSRDQRNENHDRVTANRRQITRRSEERRTQTDDLRRSGENMDRSLSRERIQNTQRDREFRIMNNVNMVLDRSLESRSNIRNNNRQSRDIRDHRIVRVRGLDSRDSRRMLSLERDNRLSGRRARSLDLQDLRDTRVELTVNRGAEIVQERDASRRTVANRNRMEAREQDNVDINFQRAEIAKNYEMFDKNDNLNEAMATNWQYIFYTLQGAYLCSLFVQLMTPNVTEKSKIMNLHWRPLASQRLIKVD